MNFCYFMECDDTPNTPESVPFVNLLANRLTTLDVKTIDLKVANTFEVKDFKSTGISTLNGVTALSIETKSIDTAVVGTSPPIYSRLTYFLCESSFDASPYAIPIPAINTFGVFKGPVNGPGTTPQNYGNFEIEYTLSLTSSVANNAISIFTQFGSSGIGQCDITLPSGSCILVYKIYIEATGGTANSQNVTYYSTMSAYTSGFLTDFNEGGAITLQTLTLPMVPTFNIRSNQLATAWTATRRKYIFHKY
jgi:hypothetical protein